MRDDRIYQMHEANVRRTFLLLSQFEFLQTKIQAHEEIMASGWKARFRALFDWEGHMRLVDNVQKVLLTERKAAFEKARATPIIKPVMVGANG